MTGPVRDELRVDDELAYISELNEKQLPYSALVMYSKLLKYQEVTRHTFSRYHLSLVQSFPANVQEEMKSSN